MEVAKRPIDTGKGKPILRGVVALAILSVFACLPSWGHPAILPHPTRVDAYKVESEWEYRRVHDIQSHIGWAPPGAIVMDNCLVIDGPKHLGAGFARRLNATVLNPSTFTRDPTHCVMEPGFILRIWQGSRSEDVVLCFHCYQVETISRDAEGHENAKSEGGIGGGFGSLVREAFPNDPLFTKRHR